MNPLDKVKKVHCSRCLQNTNHQLCWENSVSEKSFVDQESGHGWWQGYHYTVFKCSGCENVVMRKDLTSSEINCAEDWDDSYRSWHPALISRKRPDWLHELAPKQQEILKEIYAAYQADLTALTMMGLRTVLDQFIVEKIGDVGTFTEKLKKLKADGYIAAKQFDTFSTALDAGNAAAHRSYQPSSAVLGHVFDVVETLLHQDLLAKNSVQVGTQIPQRE